MIWCVGSEFFDFGIWEKGKGGTDWIQQVEIIINAKIRYKKLGNGYIILLVMSCRRPSFENIPPEDGP